MVICLERGADLHVSQLMPLPITVPCFSKIQIGITFLLPAHRVSPGQRAVKWVCVGARDSYLGLVLIQLNLPKWILLKWITNLNGYHLYGPI